MILAYGKRYTKEIYAFLLVLKTLKRSPVEGSSQIVEKEPVQKSSDARQREHMQRRRNKVRGHTC